MTPHHIHTSHDTHLFFRSWGDGPPLVFLSGWGLSSDVWAYQMLPLSEAGFRCVAYDRRGHGRSSDPGRGYDADTLADDLGQVLEQLDLRDATLIGQSMGAAEAVRYLARHGSRRIARLVLISPALPFLLRTTENPGGMDADVFDQTRQQIGASFVDWMEAGADSYLVPETSRAVKEWIIGIMRQTSLQAAVELNRAISATDFRADLASITLPTLVVHGDADVSLPLEITGRTTAALIRGAELHVYEGAPHGLYFTHAARLNRDIEAFCGIRRQVAA